MTKRQQTTIAVLALAALIGLSAATRAGSVMTVSGRREGAVALQPGVVKVGAEEVKWSDVMLVVNDAAAAPPAAPSALRLKNGEILVGKITNISKTTVSLDSTVFGAQEIATDRLSAIDFVPGLGEVQGEKKGSLYRDAGNPVSGKILWLKGDRLAIDTPIGAVELKATGLKRYVFDVADAAAISMALDEVRLNDGSVLRGTVEPAQNSLTVGHQTLGNRTFGPQAWRSVRRYSGPAFYLSDLQPVAVETFPLIRRPADKPRMEFKQDGAVGPVSRILVSPKSRMEYKIPGKPGGTYLLTAAVQLSAGSRGCARLEIRVGGKPQLAKVLSPSGEKLVPVSLDVPVDSELEITVDFDDRVRFPCGVSIDNALLVKK